MITFHRMTLINEEGPQGHTEEQDKLQESPWLREKAVFKKYYADLLEDYIALNLTLPIEDQTMRRICQVLTNAGFTTVDSCEGHGERLPAIFFECTDQLLLRNLVHVITRGAHTKRSWSIKLYSSDPYLNPDNPLSFVLQPDAYERPINPKTQHQTLLQDLDVIGLAITQSIKRGWWVTES